MPPPSATKLRRPPARNAPYSFTLPSGPLKKIFTAGFLHTNLPEERTRGKQPDLSQEVDRVYLLGAEGPCFSPTFQEVHLMLLLDFDHDLSGQELNQVSESTLNIFGIF